MAFHAGLFAGLLLAAALVIAVFVSYVSRDTEQFRAWLEAL